MEELDCPSGLAVTRAQVSVGRYVYQIMLHSVEHVDWYQTSKLKNSKICAHTYSSIYISQKNLCLSYFLVWGITLEHKIACILGNGEVIKYHKFISVVVIELSVRCLNTGLEDRL